MYSFLRTSILGAPGWLSRLSVQLLTLASGHDLTVHCTDSVEPAWDSLSVSLSLSTLLSLSLSLKINKINIKKNQILKNKKNINSVLDVTANCVYNIRMNFSKYHCPRIRDFKEEKKASQAFLATFSKHWSVKLAAN